MEGLKRGLLQVEETVNGVELMEQGQNEGEEQREERISRNERMTRVI